MFLLILTLISCTTCSIFAKEVHWNWKKINVAEIYFPGNFLWGCADSAWQTEGRQTVDGQSIENSWTEYEKMVDSDGTSVHDREPVGNACERWTHYQEDIQLMSNLGMNAYRFGVEWSKIEPEEGVFDERAMQHYIEMVDAMLAQGITPMITLFHHTYPLWFLKKGAFEKKENMQHFVRYALYVFQRLHDKVPFWLVFNEPISFSIEAYFRGHYPPRKKSLRLAGKVARNQLRTFVDVSKLFKAMDPHVQIGVAHIIQPLDVYHRWNPAERVAARLFNFLINKCLIEYFRTGKFNWAFMVRDYNADAPNSLDFIGVNYYTNTRLKQTGFFHMSTSRLPDEQVIETDKTRNKALYAEGLYRAIKKVSVLNKPIYITENGCANEDPAIKDEFLKKHLYALSQAIKKGFDVRGYFYWTLMDCFCWRRGYKPKYGIYAVDFATQDRTLRPGYEYLLNTIRKFSHS